MTTGNRLALAMRRVGMTQEALASALGVEQATVSKMVRGEFPGRKHWYKISDILGISVEWLSLGDNPPPWAFDHLPPSHTASQHIAKALGGTYDRDQAEAEYQQARALAGNRTLALIGETSAGDGESVLMYFESPRDLAIPDHWQVVQVRGDSAYPVIYSGQFAVIDGNRSYDSGGLRESLREKSSARGKEQDPAAKEQIRHDLANNVVLVVALRVGKEICLLKRFCEDEHAPDGFVLASVNSGISSPYVAAQDLRLVAPVVAVLFEDPRLPREPGRVRRPTVFPSALRGA